MKKNKINLNIACGVHLLKNFINVDKYFDYQDLVGKKDIFKNAVIEKGAKFVRGDIINLPFKDNYADYILSVDTIEHVKTNDVPRAMSELYRVLKKGGKLTLSTPDFDDIAERWIKMKNEEFDIKKFLDLTGLIYGNQAGYEDGEMHKTPFTVYYLNLLLQTAGFKKYTLDWYPGGTKPPKMKGYYKILQNGKFFLKSAVFVVNAIK